jgi:mRNA interferase MazF
VVIRQGDIYRIDLGEPVGSSPGYAHPHVVIQNSVFNQSRINTVLVCALTSNLKRAARAWQRDAGRGRGSPPKRSVVVVSQLFTVDRSQVGEFIGSLSVSRVRQILDGIKLLTERVMLSETSRAWPGRGLSIL